MLLQRRESCTEMDELNWKRTGEMMMHASSGHEHRNREANRKGKRGVKISIDPL